MRGLPSWNPIDRRSNLAILVFLSRLSGVYTSMDYLKYGSFLLSPILFIEVDLLRLITYHHSFAYWLTRPLICSISLTQVSRYLHRVLILDPDNITNESLLLRACHRYGGYNYFNLLTHSLVCFVRYLDHLFQYSADELHKVLGISMYSNQVAGHTNEVLVRHKNYLMKPSRKECSKKLLFLRELLIYEGFDENIHASDACRVPFHFVPKVIQTSLTHLCITH